MDAITESRAIVDRWLGLVDAGQFLDSWQEMAEHARNEVSKELFAKKLKAAREPLGLLVQRSMKQSAELADLEGAPPGSYIMFEFDSQFSDGTTVTERATTMRDPDGAYRVAGYYLV